ncbi:MAG: hypothetical protein GXY20_10270 [Clostridiales bacterium]|nr:hypothetical protein [Clostridiales bacterium]
MKTKIHNLTKGCHRRLKRPLAFIMVLSLLASLLLLTALAAETGWVSASGNANNNSVSNPENAYSQNNLRATFNSSSDSVEYTFGSGLVPSNAEITGIAVRIDASKSSDSTRTFNLQLRSGQSNRGASKNSGTLPNSDTGSYIELGGAADKWGYEGWTASKINSGFRVRIQSTSGGSSA